MQFMRGPCEHTYVQNKRRKMIYENNKHTLAFRETK